MLSDTMKRAESAAASLEDEARFYRSGIGRDKILLASAIREVCAELKAARERIAELKGAIAADDKRLLEAGQRVGIISGCDTPSDMADVIEQLRDRVAELESKGGG